VRHRLAAVALTATSFIAGPLLAGPIGAAHAGPAAAPAAPRTTSVSPGNDEGDWWCVYADPIDFGYCQSDPLPDRLPIPGTTGAAQH
jgi:hypothetical protein